jgi:hypothetical protein
MGATMVLVICRKVKNGLRLVGINSTFRDKKILDASLKLEAAAYSTETGELLMHRVVKTDLVLARAPDPPKRPVVTAKPGPAGGGARFRIASYNVLAEIYATQQQYPYCDIWALSWDYRYVIVSFLIQVIPLCTRVLPSPFSGSKTFCGKL